MSESTLREMLEEALKSCGTGTPRTGDRQVVHRLVTEALRSMPDGRRIDGYAVKIEEDEEGSVYFVRDSGPIPEWGVPAVLFLEHREGKSDE